MDESQPKSIDDLRRDINAIDDQLHDLLMRRAGYASQIAGEKRRIGAPLIQPDREVAVIKRLLARHHGNLPRESVARIWREMIGALSVLQLDVKVAVAAPFDVTGFPAWDIAKDYFASVLPMSRAESAMSALSAVRDGDATFAVVPMPADEDANPWWRVLTENSDQDVNPLRIVARLPIGDRNRQDARPGGQALVVARLRFAASGDDRSFLLLDLDGAISRGRIVERCGEAGLTALFLGAWLRPGAGRSAYLVEVEGFVDAGDKRLASLLARLDPAGRATTVGGYAAPLVYGDVAPAS